jgi:predicted Fe-Mo cluster-binding NifX family protein
MRFAISTDGEYVSPHFGRCPSFTILDIVGKEVVKEEILENPGHHPGYLPEFLHNLGVNSIICGGIGQRAIGLFENFNIKVISGIEGKINDIKSKLIEEDLKSRESFCQPGSGKNYGVEKTECEHK